MLQPLASAPASSEKSAIVVKPQAVSFGQGLVRGAAALLGAR
jgi:hypothetical protein